ncbi:MAG: hypothetical protein R3E48_08745 [Burkholderiaceae bacterium]
MRGDTLVTADGTQIDADEIVWVTQAGAPPGWPTPGSRSTPMVSCASPTRCRP